MADVSPISIHHPIILDPKWQTVVEVAVYLHTPAILSVLSRTFVQSLKAYVEMVDGYQDMDDDFAKAFEDRVAWLLQQPSFFHQVGAHMPIGNVRSLS